MTFSLYGSSYIIAACQTNLDIYWMGEAFAAFHFALLGDISNLLSEIVLISILD